MKKIILWDVDTQKDFMEPTGKLSVPGADKLKPNLKTLTRLGAEKARLCGSVDAHLPDDPEFKDWPPHCVYGTPGQHKIPETLIEGTLYIPTAQLTEAQLMEAINYPGQVIFEKQDNDVRTNTNAIRFMEHIKPDLVIIYGVVTEICVNQAVEFIDGDLGLKAIIVLDAVKELDQAQAMRCQTEWRKHGAELLNTREVEKILA